MNQYKTVEKTSPKHARQEKYKPGPLRKLGFVALSALTVAAAYNTLSKDGKVKPGTISELQAKIGDKYGSPNTIKGFNNLTLVPTNSDIVGLNNNVITNSDGTPAGNEEGTLKRGSPPETFYFATLVEGQSGNVDVSSSDTYAATVNKEGQVTYYDISAAVRAGDEVLVGTNGSPFGKTNAVAHVNASGTNLTVQSSK